MTFPKKSICLFVAAAIVLGAGAQQQRPAGVANTYTLTEADGFPGYNYVNFYYQFPSGKIYAMDFFGNFHITGNNFVRYIPELNGLANGSAIIKTMDDEVWIADQKKVLIVKADTLYKSIPFPAFEHLQALEPFKNYAYVFRQTKDSLSIYALENYEWVMKKKVSWNKEFRMYVPTFSNAGEMYLVAEEPGKKMGYYLMDTVTCGISYKKTVPYNSQFIMEFYKKGLTMDANLKKNFEDFIFNRKMQVYKNENILSLFIGPLVISRDHNTVVCRLTDNLVEVARFDTTHILPGTVIFEAKDKPNDVFRSKSYPYLTALMGNRPLRVFLLIKKYPRIYNGENVANVFALAQDDAGRIWAGSYQNNMSIVEPVPFHNTDPIEYVPGKVTQLSRLPSGFMNASLNHKGKMYFVGEYPHSGIFSLDISGKAKRVNPVVPVGFYLYKAPKNKWVLMPSAEGPDYPVYYCKEEELDKPYINWQKLGKEEGIAPIGFTTITEDKTGRLWMGHPKKGFAVYDPVSKKGKSYDARLNESPIGFISSLTDSKGTVWMGSDDKGLWYYNDYSKPAVPANLGHINHPLLNTVKRITAMTVYENWLVLGCYNKICLLNLDSFYLKNKAVVRYLNPQEAAFTSFTEQNTMLVSKKDSTLWFSTSDMLYQWDIKTWLQSPVYKVNVSSYFVHDSSTIPLTENRPLRLKAGLNSFEIKFEYLSPDCLPRYTRTAFVRKGDSLVYSEPSLTCRFDYKNLGSGKYIFYLEIFEQDGSVSHYRYEIIINKYLWQHWWFWLAASFLFLLPFMLWLNALRKQAIQAKRMSQLNVVSLSSQFRPHFILNALNTIGADLKEKPVSETVISRLGDSINLIFNYTKKNKVTHAFADEWRLVLNVIEIHRAMYIPSLQVHLPEEKVLNEYKDIQVPMGILEILVENALLHGLRNRKEGPYILSVSAQAEESNCLFIIRDNGVGRKGAMQMSSYKGHGTGVKNLYEIIAILNRHNRNKISIVYKDDLSTEAIPGTEVTVTIPLNYKYEY